jgi:cyclase
MRTVIQSSLLALAALTVMELSAAAQAWQDFSNAEIKTTQIGSNLYVLEGAGVNMAVLAGPDGILVVDSQYPPMTQKAVTAVRQISNGPVRFLINTHLHGDHTGGNQAFGNMGAIILARPELRERLAHRAPSVTGEARPELPAALPLVTYAGGLTIHMNGETVELLPVPRAHTDGDTLVRFAVADVLVTGDFYRSVGFPNINLADGGTVDGTVNALGVVIAMAGPNTKIIPGHGPIVDRSAVIAHRDLIPVIRDRVAKLIEQGKTQEEVLAAHPAADYETKVSQPGITEDRFIGQLFTALKTAQ